MNTIGSCIRAYSCRVKLPIVVLLGHEKMRKNFRVVNFSGLVRCRLQGFGPEPPILWVRQKIA